MDNPTKTNQEAQGPTIQCQMMKRKKLIKKDFKKD
jgi:hypothetical protein